MLPGEPSAKIIGNRERMPATELAEFTGKACCGCSRSGGKKTAGAPPSNVALVVRGLWYFCARTAIAVDGWTCRKNALKPHPEKSHPEPPDGILCGRPRPALLPGADLEPAIAVVSGLETDSRRPLPAFSPLMREMVPNRCFPLRRTCAPERSAWQDGKHDAGGPTSRYSSIGPVPYDVADLIYGLSLSANTSIDHFNIPLPLFLRQNKKADPKQTSRLTAPTETEKTANRRYTLHREKTFAVVPPRTYFLYPHVY